MKSFVKIIRPLNCFITFIAIFVGAVFCSKGSLNIGIIVLASISGALTAAAGNVINDIFDLEIDKINRPERPLPKGKISKNEATVFYIFLNTLALIGSYIINLNAFLTVLFTVILLFVYSYKLKKIPLVGNFIVSFMTGLAFVYGGIAVQNYSLAIIPALFAILINFVREIVKDIEDIEGDSKSGITTFPFKYGIKSAKILVLFLSILLILATFFPFVFKLYKIEYFVFVMAVVNPIMIYVVKSLFENSSLKNLNKLSILLKLNMVLGLLAIYLGK